MANKDPEPDPWSLAAARLYLDAKKRALKRKTLTHSEAGELLEIPAEDVPKAAWPIHVWCWVRGMPPLNVVVVRRGKTADPEGGFTATDFDVFHEAMGHTVYTLEHVWFYPWEKVPDPSPEQLDWALAAHGQHYDLLRTARFLDLEMELRLRDEARGRKRAVPSGHLTWKAAEEAHRAAFASLKAVGFAASDVRPPGKGPYPPPRPVKGNWAD